MFVEEKICRNYTGNAFFFCNTDTFSRWELTNGRGTFICLEVEGGFVTYVVFLTAFSGY